MSTVANKSKFVQAIDANMEGCEAVSAGICAGCTNCQESLGYCCEHSLAADIDNVPNEPHFSHSSCDCCGSSLGGDRYPGHYILTIDEEHAIQHMDVCVDCLVYLANGDEPENWEG